MRRLPVRDEERTVAAVIETPVGLLMVFGTVLPWHCDRGRHERDAVVPNWSEHYRVIVEQAEEWRALRSAYPDAALCVAGDLNVNLGGPHYFGTNRGRDLLREAMQQNGLACTTETDRIPVGMLAYPPIDHILISNHLADRTLVVAGWEGRTRDGVRLSDHSGLAVELS
jgi:endonuclease/exonuclease/phosphatase family metal-dependent hydrolase